MLWKMHPEMFFLNWESGMYVPGNVPPLIGIDIWALKCSSSLRMRDMYIPINVPPYWEAGTCTCTYPEIH